MTINYFECYAVANPLRDPTSMVEVVSYHYRTKASSCPMSGQRRSSRCFANSRTLCIANKDDSNLDIYWIYWYLLVSTGSTAPHVFRSSQASWYTQVPLILQDLGTIRHTAPKETQQVPET